ncbi:MAG: beta-ketoacyl-ACP synthase 3 [Spirochaetales bacterium]|jgi:2-oxoisovalerate dehydrogenase E1 component|nr:beta-ketoacyl-ACP synthase 3 [Spirochaetales bacterium]
MRLSAVEAETDEIPGGSAAGDTRVLLKIYQAMVLSREIGILEKNYVGRGEASFFVSSAGHEAGAALSPHLVAQDWLHCHYRDQALMLARGMSAQEFFLSLFARDASESRGRQMHSLISCRRLNILSTPTPVGNGALQAAGIAAVCRDQPERPLVLCGLGDGMTQEGEVLEAFAHTAREGLPVLFHIQDNGLAISTKTEGKTFFSFCGGDGIIHPESIFGIPICYADGANAEELYRVFGAAVRKIRETRLPRIVISDMKRLSSHSNADDQKLYRSVEEIAELRANCDPLVILRDILIRRGESPEDLEALQAAAREEAAQAARAAQAAAAPVPMESAQRPYPESFYGSRGDSHADETVPETVSRSVPLEEGMTMLEALRETLRFHLETDPRIFLFGEDIEDPKGDVFGLTRGLSSAFPGRVVNSPLAESTIIGYAAGRALAGGRPVAFVQFADFLPVAFNQIFSEVANIYWRSAGSWEMPLIVLVSCGAYRPGLGPFHAASMEAFAAHIPGLDVFMPSTAADAGGLLNAAFESQRPTVLFYPKALLNDRSLRTTAKARDLFTLPGKARFLRRGQDVTFTAYGNTLGLCLRAAETLEGAGISADVIDLRSIQPWDEEAVVQSASRTGRLLIVHEDSKTCGMGAEIAATVAEHASRPVAIRRVCRPDTWVPFQFENQLDILPSYERVLEAAAALLGVEVVWKEAPPKEEGIFVVEAAGSSPADESVTVIEWKVKPGDEVREGMLLAELEADKAALELVCPAAGTVSRLLVEEGAPVRVGTPLMYIQTEIQTRIQTQSGVPAETKTSRAGRSAEITGSAFHQARHTRQAAGQPSSGTSRPSSVGILGIAGTLGSRKVSNDELVQMCPSWSAADIVKRTGIESRAWLGEGESALTLALSASRKVLEKTGLRAQEIDLIVCSTGTPLYTSPSLAAMIQHGLGAGSTENLVPAYDISAACCGYLYGLQIIWDFLQSQPHAKALLVTAETLSQKTDTSDPATAPIFSDAATASILTASQGDGENGENTGNGVRFSGKQLARFSRPLVSANGEEGNILRVPAGTGTGDKIFMEGQKVFLEAVRGMLHILDAACGEQELSPDKLDLIVPHQANQRIISAVRQKLRLPEEKVFSNIRHLGNSSSSTIPLCLETILSDSYTWPCPGPHRIGLAAFGGGFTFGGAILELE